MRKIAVMLLVTAILMSALVPVSAAKSTIEPRYINTNQAKVVMGITSDGVAKVNVSCIGNSNATRIQTVTYIERLVGSSWVRVSNGMTGNQWTESVNARYLIRDYSCQLYVAGIYRAVTQFTVSGTVSETFTLYQEATY